jgi:unsaturated chondroitin disaccharide hydrolase
MKMNEITKLKSHEEIGSAAIAAGLDFACEQILRILPDFTDKFQPAYSVGNFYSPSDNTDWTNGFWTGEIWLAYEYLKRRYPEMQNDMDRLYKAGKVQVKSFLNRIEKKISVDHHDMGFLYSPSCVAAYKLTGDEDARKAAILAADQLLTRFQPVPGFLQAWGPMDQKENYRLIIDCLLNVPLLFWASGETGDDRYRDIALKHIHTAVDNVICKDGSTWHTFFFDPVTGKPDHGETCQGYRNGSAWSRGQAWGIYGMAEAYRYTRDPEYIALFYLVADYFLEHLPDDLIPYWDLEFTSWTKEQLEADPQPFDSSAASIAACGMLEMSAYLTGDEADIYRGYAKKLMKAVFDKCAVHDTSVSNGLVLHSTYSNHSPYNTCNHYGVDECNSWGDYFYMEALTRLDCDWEVYW